MKRSPGREVQHHPLYLYAIAPAACSAECGSIGIDSGAVYSIVEGGLSAVVSDVPDRLRPERRHLAAHQAVLKQVGSATTILPMSFGVVLDGADAVRRALTRNKKSLLDQLGRLSGCIEMGLRLAWSVPNIFDYFVDIKPELRAARDQCFGHHREPQLDERIEVGRLFESLLAAEREMHTEAVEEVVARHSIEIKRLKPRNEREITNLACLLERTKEPEFEAAVFEAASRFDNNFSVDYSGPWAPHNFVDVKLDLGAPALQTQ
jgi:hypothetical protein